jgi:hypothetical protein
MYKKSLFNREQAEKLIQNIEATAVHEENAELLLKTSTL